MPTGTWFSATDSVGLPHWNDPTVGDLAAPVLSGLTLLSPGTVRVNFTHPTSGVTVDVFKRTDPGASWDFLETVPLTTGSFTYAGLALGKVTFFSAIAKKAGFADSARSNEVSQGRGPTIAAISADDAILPAEFPLIVSGAADLEQTVNVNINGVNKAVVADAIGNWTATYTFSEVLSGLKTVLASLTLPFSQGVIVTSRAFTVGPQVPVIFPIPQGQSPVTVIGTALPGAAIKLYLDSVLRSSSIVADQSGNWSFQTTVVVGQHFVSASQFSNGLESAQSGDLAFVVTSGTGVEPPPGPIPEPELPVGPALSIFGSSAPLDQGDSRVYQVLSENEIVQGTTVESSQPGVVKATNNNDGTFTLEVIGGGAEQVTIHVRKSGYAATNIVLKIIPSFAVVGAIVVSGDRGMLDQLRRRG